MSAKIRKRTFSFNPMTGPSFLLYLCGKPVPEVWGWKRGEGEECRGGAPGSRQPEAEAESIECFIEGQASSWSYAMVPRPPPPAFPSERYLSFSVFLCVASRAY
jgi:hypothetical protein